MRRWARVREDVEALIAEAESTDGVAPLSEQFLLALARDGSATAPKGADGTRHVTEWESDTLVGYAQVAADGSAELVVAPAHRRRGHGRALAQTVLTDTPDARFWAHGDLPAARALAADLGLEVVRELHRMARPLTPEDAAAPTFPDGYRLRTFVPGQDEDDWIALNAAAFADHPEQGSVDRAGLAERMAQPWFDSAGFFLLEDVRGPDGPRLAGFHWTKVDPAERASHDSSLGAGEVYVVGVHPDHQGRGLAGPLTAAGTSHLARAGLGEVVLYVDGDNTRALATYRRAGFHSAAVDVMYSPRIHPPLEG
ncbi:mycothiol synthase [Janibacter sp. G1551]|uniref:mycothiol synthase n=1 Tax=Janibacter sp. G1551 TaxID=3420440 RepID=UPI003CFCFCDE